MLVISYCTAVVCTVKARISADPQQCDFSYNFSVKVKL